MSIRIRSPSGGAEGLAVMLCAGHVAGGRVFSGEQPDPAAGHAAVGTVQRHSRQATFGKSSAWLLKKAQELGVLCEADLGVLIFDSAGRQMDYCSPHTRVDCGVNVSGAGPCDNPLVTAAEKGLTEAIECLLEAGTNPNVFDKFGRLPIELAAEYGTREDVEILFPFTSPVSPVANWSVDGILSHVKMEIKQLEDENFVKKRMKHLRCRII